MKVAIIGDILLSRSGNSDIDNNVYLNPRQKAFLKANRELTSKTRKGTKKEQLTLNTVDLDWYYNDAYEIVEIKSNKVNEVERNTYTEHVFEDGTVIGEVERLTW